MRKAEIPDMHIAAIGCQGDTCQHVRVWQESKVLEGERPYLADITRRRCTHLAAGQQLVKQWQAAKICAEQAFAETMARPAKNALRRHIRALKAASDIRREYLRTATCSHFQVES